MVVLEVVNIKSQQCGRQIVFGPSLVLFNVVGSLKFSSRLSSWWWDRMKFLMEQ